MMQEVSIMVAYDAHVVDRPGEEDALARLVARSRPLRTPRPVVGPFGWLALSAFLSLVGLVPGPLTVCRSQLFLLVFVTSPRPFTPPEQMQDINRFLLLLDFESIF